MPLFQHKNAYEIILIQFSLANSNIHHNSTILPLKWLAIIEDVISLGHVSLQELKKKMKQ